MLITQKQCIELYGDPGVHSSHFDPSWRKANLVTRRGLSGTGLPGVPDRFYFECHRLRVANIEAGLVAAHKACPSYVLVSAASWVYRRMQWDTFERAEAEHRQVRPWSVHAWGCAEDWNPHQNSAHNFPVGHKPTPFSPEWRKVWPDGMPEDWIRAYCEASHSDWGGDWQGLVDPMHTQAKAP